MRRSKSSTVCSSNDMPSRGVGMPTLLNTTSSRPNCSTQAADRGGDIVVAGHVDTERDRGTAGLLDQAHGLLGAVDVEVGADDLGALLGEAQRRGAADARCRHR